MFRDGGLVAQLSDRGLSVESWVEVEGFTWRPDRASPRAQHVEEVRRVVLETASRVEAALGAGQIPLVLGGDCTVGIGTVAGAVGAGRKVGLVYLDRHADLNTPESVAEGTLDWMGMSQMLDARNSIEPIAGAFAARPLLEPARVVILGADEEAWTPWEREEAVRLRLPRVGIDPLCEDPSGTAEKAVGMLEDCDALLVHFDVDLLDFVDSPYSENIDRNSGPGLAQAAEALQVLCSDPRFTGLTVAEVNPAHASSDDPELRRLAGVVADACHWASARSS